MLTLEHIQLRRRKAPGGPTTVEVVPLCGLPHARALELAAVAFQTAQAHAGQARAALEEALDDVVASAESAREARFTRGLKKLTLDACAFDVEAKAPPEVVRAEVFLEAARARARGTFARTDVLGAIAARRELTPHEVESALFADLTPAHIVQAIDVADAADLLARTALGELQAVMLRTTRLLVEASGTPQQLRGVLRALKFHQLLFDVEARAEDGLRLVVEGPMGLFQQSTRYGLKLALLLPALLACGRLRLEAQARLRREGGTERVVMEGAREGLPPFVAPPAPAVVQELLTDLEAAGPPWRPRAAQDVIRLPGAAAIVPDLELVHEETGEVVAVEVLGFWSRAAVWRRVELVERGLPVRMVFCVSERLRVSEEALPADASAALVTFKGSLRAARVRQAADRVAERRRR